uniref:Cytochrome c oxidase subunit 3 n=1 Tax=Centrorhynchus aluconis TaxID=1795424 RepID=A0A140DJ70_9BILA|nr:cytochrome c oxidase subunit 3 [Centrorhynchus aluconis]
MVLSVSMWPFVVSVGSFMAVLGAVLMVSWALIGGLMMLAMGFGMWAEEDQIKWIGVVGEAGQSGSSLGVLIFIFTEMMFFLSLMVSGVYLVDGWDAGEVVDMQEVPLFISMILLSSGVTITVAHQFMHSGRSSEAGVWGGVTILLGVLFVSVQYGEWRENWFELFDGVGGSLFYFVTGFHGLHVMLGLSLNLVLFVLLVGGGFSEVSGWKTEGVVWYWHFVDVVWLFVYLVVYWYCM